MLGYSQPGLIYIHQDVAGPVIIQLAGFRQTEFPGRTGKQAGTEGFLQLIDLPGYR